MFAFISFYGGYKCIPPFFFTSFSFTERHISRVGAEVGQASADILLIDLDSNGCLLEKAKNSTYTKCLLSATSMCLYPVNSE